MSNMHLIFKVINSVVVSIADQRWLLFFENLLLELRIVVLELFLSVRNKQQTGRFFFSCERLQL